MAISITEMKTRLEARLGSKVALISQGAYENGDVSLRVVWKGDACNWDITRQQSELEAEAFDANVLAPLAHSMRLIEAEEDCLPMYSDSREERPSGPRETA